MRRDFTYIDDFAEVTLRVLDHTVAPDAGLDPTAPDPGSSRSPKG